MAIDEARVETLKAIICHSIKNREQGIKIDRTGLTAQECEMLDLGAKIAEGFARMRSEQEVNEKGWIGTSIVNARNRFKQ